jgi:hypothetical protein
MVAAAIAAAAAAAAAVVAAAAAAGGRKGNGEGHHCLCRSRGRDGCQIITFTIYSGWSSVKSCRCLGSPTQLLYNEMYCYH